MRRIPAATILGLLTALTSGPTLVAADTWVTDPFPAPERRMAAIEVPSGPTGTLAETLDEVNVHRLLNRTVKASQAAARLDGWSSVITPLPIVSEWIHSPDPAALMRGLKALIYLKPADPGLMPLLPPLLSHRSSEVRIAAVLAMKELTLEYRLSPSPAAVAAFAETLGAEAAHDTKESRALKRELVGTLLLFERYNRKGSPLFTRDFSISESDRTSLASALARGCLVPGESPDLRLRALELIRAYHPNDPEVTSRVAALVSSDFEPLRQAARDALERIRHAARPWWKWW